ncbi:MAG: hypothetical protein AAGB03_07195 [Pseudomonadota bacterium]
MKTSTLSVRVDDDDAAFLASLELSDARTPSEKLRALLRAERQRRAKADNRVEAGEMFADMLKPARRRVRSAETDHGMRSEFVAKLFDRLPEVMAAAFVGPPQSSKAQVKDLAKFESQILDEMFLWIQEILEMGLTRKSRCYDPAAVEQRLEPVVEIVTLIIMAQERREERS